MGGQSVRRGLLWQFGATLRGWLRPQGIGGVLAEDLCQRGAGKCPGPKATRGCHAEQAWRSDSGAEGSWGTVASLSRFFVWTCFSNVVLLLKRGRFGRSCALAPIGLPGTVFFSRLGKDASELLSPTKK